MWKMSEHAKRAVEPKDPYDCKIKVVLMWKIQKLPNQKGPTFRIKG